MREDGYLIGKKAFAEKKQGAGIPVQPFKAKPSSELFFGCIAKSKTGPASFEKKDTP